MNSPVAVPQSDGTVFAPTGDCAPIGTEGNAYGPNLYAQRAGRVLDGPRYHKAKYRHCRRRQVECRAGEYCKLFIQPFPILALAPSGSPHGEASWAELRTKHRAETSNKLSLTITAFFIAITLHIWASHLIHIARRNHRF